MTELPEGLHDLPVWTPDAVELADLELLLTGAFAPLTGFQGSYDASVVIAGGRLADGTAWPVPITLTVPKDLTGEARVVLQDPEGVPLAVLEVTEVWQFPSAPAGPGGGAAENWQLAGTVSPLRAPAHGPFHRLRRRPDEVRALLNPGPVLAVTTREPLHRKQLGQLRQEAERLATAAGARPGSAEAQVLLLPLLSGAHDESLVRSLLAVRKELPDGALIVPVPLAPRPESDRDLLLRSYVAAAYGGTHLFADEPVPGSAIPVVVPEPWAYDADVEVWRPISRIEPDHVKAELTSARLGELLERGEPIPDWFTPPAVAAELRAARPPRHQRGVTVFFTGLSGSGKSTVARALADAVVERGGRTISLLDGDVVRRLLSAGLTFSKADRDLNIRRIGYVAAEVTRHGGMAICAPIAPYAATRAEVRRMVSAVGDFVLIHVATPLEECERRDRKGLYAKARAGLIPEFTGISDPYEEPSDADLVMDTSRLTSEAALESVLELLVSGGWIRQD